MRSQLRVVNGASGYCEFKDLSSELVSSEVVNVEVRTMGCFLFKLEVLRVQSEGIAGRLLFKVGKARVVASGRGTAERVAREVVG